MKNKILNLLGVGVFSLVGFVESAPVLILDENHLIGDNFGLAIPILNYDEFKFSKKNDFIHGFFNKEPLYYQKRNDEAVVYWNGGPILNDDWKEISKDYSWMFGQNIYSKSPVGEEIKGNVSPKKDIYWGVQTQWKSFNLYKYFKKPLQHSNIASYSFSTTARPLSVGDIEFKKDFDTKTWEKAVETMLFDQTKWMKKLGKDLKTIGYRKVHYIGMSFGGFLVNEYISKYGDDAFEYIDSITSVGSRLKASSEEIATISNGGFPFKVWDEKTNLYSKTLPFEVRENAATIGIILPIFKTLSKRDYTIPLKKLSSTSKERYNLVVTPFDFRVGSLSQAEYDLKKEGIKITEISTKELLNYEKNYLTTNTRTNIQDKPRIKLTGGINHHDSLIKYYLHNFSELYGSVSIGDNLTRKKNTYFCQIDFDNVYNCEK